MSRKRDPSPIGWTWRWVLFIVAALILNLPVVFTVFTSFKTNADINASPPVWLFAPTLQHYAEVLTTPTLNFPRYLMNSFVLAAAGTAIALVLAVPAAYAIVRMKFGGGTIVPIVLMLRTLPLVIFAIPFYFMFQWLGLLDTRLGLSIIAAIINLPFALLFAIAMVRDLPYEIEEAARVDGAGIGMLLWRIVIPLGRPMLISIAILSFIYAWNEFLFGLILTTRSATPVTVGATLFATSFGIRWGPTSAAMVLSLLPPMLVGLVCFRYLTRALTAGAIKG